MELDTATVLLIVINIANAAFNIYLISKMPLIYQIKDVMFSLGSAIGLKKGIDGNIIIEPRAVGTSILAGMGQDTSTNSDDMVTHLKKDRKTLMDELYREQAKTTRLRKKLDKKEGTSVDDGVDEDEYEPYESKDIDWTVIENIKKQIPSLASVEINTPIAQSQIVDLLNENEQIQKIYEGAVAATAFQPTTPNHFGARRGSRI